MSTIAYVDLLPYLLIEVPGCSEPLAEQAVREAVIEFCQLSNLWRYRCDPVTVKAGQADYDLDDLPRDTTLARLMSVFIDDDKLEPTSEDWLDENLRGWRTGTGRAQFYMQIDPSYMTLVPTPDATSIKGMHITVAVQPSRESTEFPRWINDQYQEALLMGVKARLLKQQGQPWYNPQLSEFYRGRFVLAAGTAADVSARSLVRTRLRTTPQH